MIRPRVLNAKIWGLLSLLIVLFPRIQPLQSSESNLDTLLSQAREIIKERPQDALGFSDSVLSLVVGRAADNNVAKAELIRAEAYKNLKEYENMEAACIRAFDFARRGGDTEAAINTLRNASTWNYHIGRFENAHEWADRMREYAIEIGDRKTEAQAYNDIGVLYKVRGDIADAKVNHSKALSIRREIGDERGISQSLMNIGIIYKNLGEYADALEYQMEALAIKERLGLSAELATSYQNIGVLYRHLKDYEQALTYYDQALEIHRETEQPIRISTTLSNLGELYALMGRHDDSMEKTKEALHIAREADNVSGVAVCLENLGSLYADLGDYDNAEITLLEAIHLAEEAGIKRSIGNTSLALARVLAKKRELNKVRQLLEKAVVVAEEIGERPLLRNAYRELQGYYTITGDTEAAYRYHELFTVLNNELVGAETATRIANLQTKYELERKQNQIELLQRDNGIKELQIARQRWIGGFIITALALVAVVALAIHYRYRIVSRAHRLLEEKNEEIAKQQTRLSKLNDDLNRYANQVQAANEALYQSSIMDGLTNAYNRNYVLADLEKEVSRAIRHGNNLSLLMIDLDHFKKINDTFGHLTGDRVLREASDMIMKQLRSEDVLGRYGGEEFIAILPDTGLDGAERSAERIRAVIEELEFSGTELLIKLTVSIGVADFESCEVRSLDGLLHCADVAMYAAKEAGRNRVVVYEGG